MYDFLDDLDEYFCEKYANYDKLCVLPGYRMPKMQTTTTDEFGRSYSYTLPANTMRLALQENKADMLKTLKSRIVDKTFSFSFRPIGFFRRIKYAFAKSAPKKLLAQELERYKLTDEDVLQGLTVDGEIWKNIKKGKFAPTQNTIVSLAIIGHFSIEDTQALLAAYGYEFNYAVEKDVVVSYILTHKVFARPMMEAAFAEYKVSNLFIK
ncbi:MAG: hypothetical protein IJY05_03600 [Clostridia bacterium]|nr:hypothetical protein [Clostridia bacterium]MBQ9113990.1 hypothetical protein [Clostridia bacterium]